MKDTNLTEYLNRTAQQLAEAGEYKSVEDAEAALKDGLAQAKQQRRNAIKNMNRYQRRKAGKKVDKLVKALEKGSLKPSQQFKALPEEEQKLALLNILLKVRQENMKFEGMKNENEAEGN